MKEEAPVETKSPEDLKFMERQLRAPIELGSPVRIDVKQRQDATVAALEAAIKRQK